MQTNIPSLPLQSSVPGIEYPPSNNRVILDKGTKWFFQHRVYTFPDTNVDTDIGLRVREHSCRKFHLHWTAQRIRKNKRRKEASSVLRFHYGCPSDLE